MPESYFLEGFKKPGKKDGYSGFSKHSARKMNNSIQITEREFRAGRHL